MNNRATIPPFANGVQNSSPKKIRVVDEYDTTAPLPLNGILAPVEKKTNWAMFLIIFFIVGVILYIAKPSWLLKVDRNSGVVRVGGTSSVVTTTGLEVDWGKLFLWTLIITLVIAFFYWLFTRAK